MFTLFKVVKTATEIAREYYDDLTVLASSDNRDRYLIGYTIAHDTIKKLTGAVSVYSASPEDLKSLYYATDISHGDAWKILSHHNYFLVDLINEVITKQARDRYFRSI